MNKFRSLVIYLLTVIMLFNVSTALADDIQVTELCDEYVEVNPGESVRIGIELSGNTNGIHCFWLIRDDFDNHGPSAFRDMEGETKPYLDLQNITKSAEYRLSIHNDEYDFYYFKEYHVEVWNEFFYEKDIWNELYTGEGSDVTIKIDKSCLRGELSFAWQKQPLYGPGGFEFDDGEGPEITIHDVTKRQRYACKIRDQYNNQAIIYFIINVDDQLEQNSDRLYIVSNSGYVVTWGWVLFNGKWFYSAGDGTVLRDQWFQDWDNTWYYFRANGEMATGWCEIGSKNYYFNSSGAMMTGWIKTNGNWYYLTNDGNILKGWLKKGENWYYLQPEDGKMVTGWIIDGGMYYYMRSSGVMATGWVQDQGEWYYLKSSGAKQTGWLQDGGSWYYLDSDGVMVIGWIKDGNTWYYMNASGTMVTGWKHISGNWYYFQDSGAMKKGWFKDKDGTWYWFDDDGVMVVGTQTIDGKQEVFSSGGAWMYTAQ